MRRREMLRLLAMAGLAAATVPASRAWARKAARTNRAGAYGRWVVRGGLPAYVYDADHESLAGAEWDPLLAPPTRRHWIMVGNEAIRLQAANDGTVGVFDERHALRWLTAADPAGSGVSLVDDGGELWGTDYARRGGTRPPERTFGPTWFEVRDVRAGLVLTRTMLCPEGAVPWVLVRVRLALAAGHGRRSVRHIERWVLRPRFLNFLESTEQRRARAEAGVSYAVTESPTGLVAAEQFRSDESVAPFLLGPPATILLERLGRSAGVATHRLDGAPHPTLEITTPVTLRAGEHRDLWFRFGHADGSEVGDPRAIFDRSRRALAARLPRATARRAPQAEREVPWHAALLTGGLAADAVIGGHTLDQGSTYSYVMGFNGAARDPLQHALPLVYIDPPRALSVLRNTCAWATPEGDLPYALDAAKQPFNLLRPSDQNLWALWLAAEYAAATGDLGAFDDPLPYYPAAATPAVPLHEHLRRQFRFFVDRVGRGEGGHVRILNADWNDAAIDDSGLARETMIERGGSVLNSAMAAWVLPVYAALAERLGDRTTAAEARAQADDLRGLVAAAWNGRWFHRAYGPGASPVGDTDCWLEVQPWAILCGAADAAQARALLDTIDRGHRAGSPLGARLRWPAKPALVAAGRWGEATLGGVWYSINMTLVWAAARVAPDLAWDEWRRMTLANHAAAYPEVWEGILSGPDAWNAPESTRPGRTWGVLPLFAMQAFPVNNSHSHSQPLLAYLRLLGVEPTPAGTLAVGSGARFASPVFELRSTGRGRLEARGPVTLETTRGVVSGGPGSVRW